MKDQIWLTDSNKRKSLGDHIYELLRDDIVYMRLTPGQMIYENEIAERLQVSRTPVREAFRLLANEQLIEVQPQRGTRVQRISIRKVNEARFIREHLESGAFRLVAKVWQNRTSKEVEEKIMKLIEQQESAVSVQDAEMLLRQDEEFHRLIISITHNETLLQVIDHMRAHINRVRFLALRDSPHMSRIPDEHRHLLDAIRAGDETLTAQLLSAHIGQLDVELPQLCARYEHYFDPSDF